MSKKVSTTLNYICYTLFIVSSCTPVFKKTRTNDLSDRKKAQEFYAIFYQYKKTRNFTSASQLASGKSITKDNLLTLLNASDSVLGNFQSCDLLTMTSKVVFENGRETGTFDVFLNCKYEKANSIESLGLLSVDSLITINGYHVKY